MKMHKMGLLAVAMVLVAAPSHAADVERIAPDFDHAEVYGGCLRLTPGDVEFPNCTYEATALEDGTVSMHLGAETPLDGAAPTPAGAGANAFLSATRDLPSVPARYFAYEVTVHIDSANASASAPGRVWFADVGFEVRASVTTSLTSWWDRTSDSHSETIATVAGGVTSVSDTDIVIPLLIGDGVRRANEGQVDIAIDFAGSATTFGPLSGGEVDARIDARVTSVTVEAIP